MILDSFTLSDKVAIVTGCDTGLGQGMAVALAQAGCDIVGVNRKNPEETAAQIAALGRRFLAIRTDLGVQENIAGIVTQAVAEMGRVDILVNNAGTIRREDALSFSEKDWDDVVNLNLKSVFFLSQAVAKQFIRQGQGEKLSTSRQCCRSRAGSACRRIRRRRAACSALPACWRTSGPRTALT